MENYNFKHMYHKESHIWAKPYKSTRTFTAKICPKYMSIYGIQHASATDK